MFQSTSDNSASIGYVMVNACAWSYIIYVCLIAYCIHIIIIYLGMKYKQQIYWNYISINITTLWLWSASINKATQYTYSKYLDIIA